MDEYLKRMATEGNPLYTPAYAASLADPKKRGIDSPGPASPKKKPKATPKKPAKPLVDPDHVEELAEKDAENGDTGGDDGANKGSLAALLKHISGSGQ